MSEKEQRHSRFMDCHVDYLEAHSRGDVEEYLDYQEWLELQLEQQVKRNGFLKLEGAQVAHDLRIQLGTAERISDLNAERGNDYEEWYEQAQKWSGAWKMLARVWKHRAKSATAKLRSLERSIQNGTINGKRS